MNILSFFGKNPTTVKTKHFEIDVVNLLASGLQRYICFMDKGEARRHIKMIQPDTTGHVVIVGGVGVVDGFSQIQSSKRSRLAVTIFELRCAQYFIKTPLDKSDKDKYGRFDPDSFYGQMMFMPDLEKFDGKDHR